MRAAEKIFSVKVTKGLHSDDPLHAAHRAEVVEAARMRVCAAVRHADPIDVEAAARAYGGTLLRVTLARAWNVVVTLASVLWRRIHGPPAGAVHTMRLDS
ncbi:hypothetical protein [Falsiroseomonas sp. E2-1-a20]|uniref:hypothetical protein n=1 Tax=Falsiroseomonas sp. E2-1-a20 TaxID=3239300 RepID=UPI003F31BF5D